MNAVGGAIGDILIIICDLLIWVLVLGALLSILVSFRVINPYNQVVSFLLRTYMAMTEPALKHIRRYVKPMNGIDFSPLIAVLVLTFIRQLLLRVVYG